MMTLAPQQIHPALDNGVDVPIGITSPGSGAQVNVVCRRPLSVFSSGEGIWCLK